jgi:hypothetical protein
MVKVGEEVFRCACPGRGNQPRTWQAGAAKHRYCGLPDPVTGEPDQALTGFRWR